MCPVVGMQCKMKKNQSRVYNDQMALPFRIHWQSIEWPLPLESSSIRKMASSLIWTIFVNASIMAGITKGEVCSLFMSSMRRCNRIRSSCSDLKARSIAFRSAVSCASRCCKSEGGRSIRSRKRTSQVQDELTCDHLFVVDRNFYCLIFSQRHR